MQPCHCPRSLVSSSAVGRGRLRAPRAGRGRAMIRLTRVTLQVVPSAISAEACRRTRRARSGPWRTRRRSTCRRTSARREPLREGSRCSGGDVTGACCGLRVGERGAVCAVCGWSRWGCAYWQWWFWFACWLLCARCVCRRCRSSRVSCPGLRFDVM